jgi:hypothetical protein
MANSTPTDAVNSGEHFDLSADNMKTLKPGTGSYAI